VTVGGQRPGVLARLSHENRPTFAAFLAERVEANFRKYSWRFETMRFPSVIRDPLLSLVRSLGYGVYKLNTARNLYGNYLPTASYSPWNQDANFALAYGQIREHTLVDEYRCYELWTMVTETKDVPGDIIEVGVWRGGTGALLARKAQIEGLGATIWLCDTYSGVVKAGERDPIYVGGEHADTSRRHVDALLQSMELNNACTLEGIFPDQTGHTLESKRFRLCHIDVDVYESGKDIVNWIWERLNIGGCIVFDDYGCETTSGIAALVNEQRGRSDRVTIHNLNGHAITIKTR
jgi:O-methyltransferase